VHLHKENIGSHLQLRLELTTITILDTHAAVELAIELIINLRGHLEECLLQVVEGRKGVVENLLLEGRLLDYSLKDFFS
jgi:hypothetical protein